MSSPLDLATTYDVRTWLALTTGLGGNSAQTNIINTTANSPIAAGTNVVVTPATMANIYTGMVLGIGNPVTEYVSVGVTTSTTFTATFALNHPETNPAISDQTDNLIARLITAASVYFLRKTGFTNSDGSIPSASVFNSQVSFNEWYDGNGNDRLFLRNRPIVSVSLLQVNGVSIPASTGFSVPGYVIDQNGRSLALRTGSGWAAGSWPVGAGSYYQRNFGSIYSFFQGTQNINVQYTAGYASTPQDVNDAIIQLVGYTFKSKGWIGQQSVAQTDNVGTIQYVKWYCPPYVDDVIDQYKRRAIV